ncbi:MAG: DUF2179 domain-containing protein [Verrucomicrobia bacterium]|nr:DUF2179 domain-containing protein [Verrucomicrobiota bacterium]MCH8526559.1 DUF2179 domain-containing protein [Kiritimatiellia bacterium]
MIDSPYFVALMIFAARICDVGLGTIRHAMIIRGLKPYAFLIAFFEALIWVYAVSSVLQSVQAPLNSMAFALGFASGTYVGMTIEDFLKIGEQVIRVFTRKGTLVTESLRAAGYRVTVFEGHGRDGVVHLLFVQSRRRKVGKAQQIARGADPDCFMILDDIRSVHMPNRNTRKGRDLLPLAPLITSDKK